MNSDFYYSDLRSWLLAKNQNRLLEETTDHYLVGSIFKNLFVHPKMVLKVNKAHYFVEEIDFYDKNSDLPKRRMKSLKVIEQDGILLATHLQMITFQDNSQSVKSSSEIILETWAMQPELETTVFSQAN